ncbi:MAG: Lsm family RNA-binding protein [Candidatus Bathyarchaeota archaeon]|nr:MAG: Lsm family RNA-binding protein [Candidatus Bathyarchaeota archaeon]
MSVAQRKFFGEIAALLDKIVTVTTVNGKEYTGTLKGINPETLSLCLAEAKDKKGRTIDRAFLNGSVIAQIFAVEKPFDLKALAERLEKVFPRLIRLYEDQGFIWVMDKIKITENGVVEGKGPTAERVQKVYNQFISEMAK